MPGIPPENLILYQTRKVLTIDEILDWEQTSSEQVDEGMISICLLFPDTSRLFDLAVSFIAGSFFLIYPIQEIKTD